MTPTESTSTKLQLTSLDVLQNAADCLRLLAHKHRLRIVQMLLQQDFSVGELASACEIQPNVASEHLRLMQHSGFLTSVRDGRNVYYRIAEPHLQSILTCIEGKFGVDEVTLS
ncbi:MAG: ArsR/SmtB family transcription factor [Gemmataceae bacterium]